MNILKNPLKNCLLIITQIMIRIGPSRFESLFGRGLERARSTRRTLFVYRENRRFDTVDTSQRGSFFLFLVVFSNLLLCFFFRPTRFNFRD